MIISVWKHSDSGLLLVRATKVVNGQQYSGHAPMVVGRSVGDAVTDAIDSLYAWHGEQLPPRPAQVKRGEES